MIVIGFVRVLVLLSFRVIMCLILFFLLFLCFCDTLQESLVNTFADAVILDDLKEWSGSSIWSFVFGRLIRLSHAFRCQSTRRKQTHS